MLPPVRSLPIVNVLVGSPGNLRPVRDAVESCIHEWTRHNSRHADAVLLPIRWERDPVPVIGEAGNGQQEINKQLLSKSHVLIAIFQERFGTPTGRYESGTEEEIEEALGLGLRVHVLFSNIPISTAVIDSSQLDLVRKFKERMQTKGLVAEFESIEQLQELVRRILADDVSLIVGSNRSSLATRTASAIRVSLVDSGTAGAIFVRNEGDSVINRLKLISVVDSRGSIQMEQSSVGIELDPGGDLKFAILGRRTLPDDLKVSVRWQDFNGTVQNEVFHL